MRTVLTLFSEAKAIEIPRRKVATVLGLQIVGSLTELLGFLSLIPIYQYLESGGNVSALVAKHDIWHRIVAVAAALGTEVTLGRLLIVSFVLVLARQVLMLLRALREYEMLGGGVASLRARLFRSFLRASADYQDAARNGDVLADFAFNSQNAVSHITSRVALVTQTVICLVYMVGMVGMSPAMTVLMLTVVGASAAIVIPGIKKARMIGRERVESDRESAQFIGERLNVTRLIRILGLEEIEGREIARRTRRQGDVIIKGWRHYSITDSAVELLAIFLAFLIIYLSIAVLGLSFTLVGLFLVMLVRLLPVVRQIARTKQAIDSGRPAFDKVVARLRQADLNREPQLGQRPLLGLEKSIKFEGISFHYRGQPDLPALTDINIEIPARAMTAIVGPSGAGKSTLIDLLPRIRAPQAGRILFDGVQQEEFSLAAVRQAIAFAPQTPQMLDLTAEEHIRSGRPDASADDIRRAAKLALAHEFTEKLPNGYDTRIGTNGSNLSGGQRRRLDLARAIVRGAPVLILDEPGAGLDTENLRLLEAAIEHIRRQTATTIIIIGHDLRALRKADRIVVINGGRVEDVGTHEELMARPGWYARTYLIGEKASPAPALL